MSQGWLLHIKFTLLIIILLALLCGCWTVEKLDPTLTSKYAGFLHDGKTTKQEIIDRLGQANSIYENGKILIYYLWMERDGRMMLQDSKHKEIIDAPKYQLILVFNDNNFLEKHSLVERGE
ncbi:MAG: hypothetical protein A4E72_01686 [Syntrophus sp. PtaU1.Bin208]|nr:MAG: hypothetical protein A4E72_01686 [Syntrophus sp. PtaU1.Bin208]